MKILLRAVACMLALGAVHASASAQQVIPLWPGKAPGTEDWNFPEKSVPQADGGQLLSDVSVPTLTAYLPERSKATGTAVIILPGGAMLYLGVPGYEKGPAKWLNDRGIAAFVLKYRVLPSAWRVNRPMPVINEYPRGNANPFPDDLRMKQVIDFAIADAHQAMRLVRKNAASWAIDPAKVGMLGYSAGGGVAVGAAVTPAEGALPDFVMSAYGPSLVDVNVPANPPPLFIAVKQYHPNVALALVALYQEWTKAKAPAELHIYDQTTKSPFLENAGDWLQRAYEWMEKRGFGAKPADPAAAR